MQKDKFRNLGRIRIPKGLLFNKSLMTQVFSNGFIVLNAEHNTFEEYVTYTINWDLLPEVQGQCMIPEYHVQVHTNSENGFKTFKIDTPKGLVDLASEESGLILYLDKNPRNTKIYYGGKILDNVQKITNYIDVDQVKTILEVIPDKIIGDLGDISFKKRNLVLDE